MVKKKADVSYDIGLSEKDKAAVVKILNVLLADLFVLYVKSLNCHWNIIGPHFGPLHLLFRQNYEMLFQHVDDVAERIRTLGSASPASVAAYAKMTRIKELSAQEQQGPEMVEALYTSFLEVIRAMRKAIDEVQDNYHDLGTGNFLTDMMEEQEKAAWMLRAHLE
jgi:starvation-inducible DNA-binding protein